MGFFRFHRSIKILPGIKINLNKKSTSLTIGRRGMHTTINKNGVRNTVGIPGSGMSYTSYKKFGKKNIVGETIPYTPVCPNCGHKMRKAWANCPTCHYSLLSLYHPTVDNSCLSQSNTSDASLGQKIGGTLILLFIVVILYKLLFG